MVDGWITIGIIVLFLNDVLFTPIKMMKAGEVLDLLKELAEAKVQTKESVIAQEILEQWRSEFNLFRWFALRLPFHMFLWFVAIAIMIAELRLLRKLAEEKQRRKVIPIKKDRIDSDDST